MDALKLIPQSFFEFFARLVPGGLAFALWMALFDGDRHWPDLLEAFAADRLDPGNVVFLACFLAISIAYGLGQLVAPLGKAAQRITELLAVPAAIFLNPARNWARGIMGKEPKVLRKKAEATPQAAGPAKDSSSPTGMPEAEGDYDWLRANKPELGALVAKVRSEYTMFYALSSVFAVAAASYVGIKQPIDTATFAALVFAAIACGCRGYFVRKTMNETAKKLRSSVTLTRASP